MNNGHTSSINSTRHHSKTCSSATNEETKGVSRLWSSYAEIEGMEGYLTRVDQCLKVVERHWPQYHIDGTRNIWILKPGAKSRGRGQWRRASLSIVASLSRYRCLRSFGRHSEAVLVDNDQRSEIRRPEVHRTPVAHSQHEIRHSSMVSRDRLESIDDLDLQRLLSSFLHRTFQSGHATAERTSLQLLHSETFQEQFQSSRRSARGEHVDQSGVHREISSTDGSSRQMGFIDLSSDETGDHLLDARRTRFDRSTKGTDDQHERQMSRDRSFRILSNYTARISCSVKISNLGWSRSIAVQPWLDARLWPQKCATVSSKILAKVIQRWSTRSRHSCVFRSLVMIDRKYNRTCDIGRFELIHKGTPVPVPIYVGIDLRVEGSPRLSSVDVIQGDHSR